MLPQALDSLFNLVYPQFCHLCAAKVVRRADGVACDECWRRTRLLDDRLVQCAKCANPLTGYPKTHPLTKREGLIDGANASPTNCHRCDEHHYDLARAAGIYENALAATIINLKSKPFVPSRLRELLVATFADAPFYDAELVVPVPLSRRRFQERGFNQAEILAEILSKETGLPLDLSSFIRAKHTNLHRAAMDRRARELTVENSFDVTRPAFIEGRKLLLIDDVLTSGATVSACAKVLKKHGAAGVYVFTVARAAGG